MKQTMDPSERAFEHVRDEMTARRILISIHASFGITVGLAMILTGAPVPLEVWFGTWTRYALGTLGIIGGLTIVIGLILGDACCRGWRALLAGMSIHAVWQSIVLVAYTTAASQAKPPIILGLGQAADPANLGRVYIPFVYLTLFLLACAHIFAIWKVQPER